MGHFGKKSIFANLSSCALTERHSIEKLWVVVQLKKRNRSHYKTR